MSSPAQRYAVARRRRELPELTRFAGLYDFELDAFQVHACEALESGHGVLVAAPTGSGKTVVGEFAVHLALAAGAKCFYTTPIKALSNQKYADLVARYGASRVGLLTGDNTVNGEAEIVVMTTEVLRNMLYAGSGTLRGLAYVVMDEVHYLADRFRGAVWEEVIIHLPADVRLVSLSATVSNAEEFGQWLVTVRGDTTVVVSDHRPVPLWQHVLVGHDLVDLFAGAGDRPVVNPALVRLAREEDRFAPARPGRGRPRTRSHPPARPDVITALDRDGLLPAITFIFSRQGCDDAVRQCLRAGLRLVTPDEREEIRAYVEERTLGIPQEDLHVLGYGEWLAGLERGVAGHHAGLLPTFKEVVEELFVRGLVRAVFATETLALGINMPARTVVLERLVKWNGQAHVDVTPGEYTQLTGRAGRRGIDVEGHAVVLWTPGMDPQALAGLASTRTYPLRSSFRPSYNMAVNLVHTVGRERAGELLESSFAQFQADAAVVGLARQLRRNEQALAGYAAAMACHLGDVEAYQELRRQLAEREAGAARARAADRRAGAAASLQRLRAGDVIRVPAGRRSGLAVVLDPGVGDGRDDPRPVVLTAQRQVRRLSTVDFPTPVAALARVRVPRRFNPRSPADRRDLAATLRTAEVPDAPAGPRSTGGRGDDPEIGRLRAAVRAHPCHGCADREDHARWAERWQRLHRETDDLQRRVADRTNSIARTFDRVCGLLAERGYLSGDEVTPAGRMLARVYAETDLLVAECLRAGTWSDLDPAELAACVSALVYETRRSDGEVVVRLPRGRTGDVLAATNRAWGALVEQERDHRLPPSREPDPGFAYVAWRWASGHRLESVLADADMAAGDFVRWVKQLVDLLDQIGQAADGDPVAAVAARAVHRLRRGVVAYTSVG